jgi:hypothetical protein
MASYIENLKNMLGYGKQAPSQNMYNNVLGSGQAINPSAYSVAGQVGGFDPTQSLIQSAVPGTGQADGGGLFSNFLDTTDKNGTKQGWGGLALGAAQGLGGAYLGMKQYGLAKDQFNESKRQFNQNFDTQAKLTDNRLEDRQSARVASNPGAYQSVSEYMKKNGVQ